MHGDRLTRGIEVEVEVEVDENYLTEIINSIRVL